MSGQPVRIDFPVNRLGLTQRDGVVAMAKDLGMSVVCCRPESNYIVVEGGTPECVGLLESVKLVEPTTADLEAAASRLTEAMAHPYRKDHI